MNKNYTAPGPIFEPGPGWGRKLKKWAKKYILGGDCTLCRATRYILVFGVIVLVVAWPKFHTPPSITKEIKVVETVRPRDGKTHLARRMLAQYLTQNQDTQISKAQKVFIETALREKITAELVAGNIIELADEEIKEAVEKSKMLSPFQLKKWELYAEAVDL